MKIAVLITCHNRVATSIQCLRALNQQDNYNNCDIFLVDDGSSDSTGESVRQLFPEVNVINGNGSLYWCGGMRLAWETAAKNFDYDFYLWLNDDVELNNDALNELLGCYKEAYNKDNKPAIITGACRSYSTSEFSYGGRNEIGALIPNGHIQQCKYINGNVVIVPQLIFKAISMLSSEYTHALGDFDYGIRAIKAGFNCYTTRNYIAYCEVKDIPEWSLSSTHIWNRLRLLHSVKGLNIKEYIRYQKNIVGWRWIFLAIKAYLTALSPYLNNKISLLLLKLRNARTLRF